MLLDVIAGEDFAGGVKYNHMVTCETRFTNQRVNLYNTKRDIYQGASITQRCYFITSWRVSSKFR